MNLPSQPRVLYIYEDRFVRPFYLQFSKFHEGFERLGYPMQRFDILSSGLDELKSAVQSFRPDVLFCFLRFGENICKMATFLGQYHPAPVLNWFQEDPNHVTKQVVEASRSFDFWFTQDPRTVPFWPTKAFFSPHAFDETWYYERNLPRTYDVSVGTLLGNPLSESMWWPYLNEAARHGKKACFLLNRPMGIPILPGPFERLLRSRRLQRVWRMLGVSRCSWEMPADEVGKAVVLGGSKIHFGIQRVRGDWEPEVRALFPDYRFDKHGLFVQTKGRLFGAAGAGAMALMDGAPEIGELFEEGEEIVTFEFGNMEDAREKLDWYIKHDAERARIARAGYERAHRHHTIPARIEQIFERLKRSA